MRPFALAAVCLALLVPVVALRAQAQGPAAGLRPGDRMVVTVRDTVDSIPLAGDGRAVLPMLGPVHLAGLAPAVAEDSVRRAYANMVRRPDVRVTALRRIVVEGEVTRANVLYVDETVRLAEALALAGGVGPEGDRRRIDIWRDGQRLARVDGRSGEALRLPLHSGDQVLVGRASWVSRNGFVVASLVSTFASIVLVLATR
jgi:protein involved in polysaccharide export with SLBB domain